MEELNVKYNVASETLLGLNNGNQICIHVYMYILRQTSLL